ncbi:hypothetical protein HT102_00620 [Hoyosella sp. G463]|uniref:Prealbumin-like fold domain-containing protein n=1 Tax=Lolliginicoccus lacisalsi TaxID=2742202 RepID=A0A927J9H6_9ACTN|nr:hypothetical protein [Lolliginicoccus lacisalsi]MBD8504991.1 hypothetical protein [Lolliginicoccus lacisalsi]
MISARNTALTALLGVALLAGPACGSGVDVTPVSGSSSASPTENVIDNGQDAGPRADGNSTGGASTQGSGASVPGSEAPATGSPASSTSGPGSILVETKTFSGAAIPSVPVSLMLAAECDAANRDIPLGADFTTIYDGVTNAAGEALFADMPLGCYRANMDVPQNTNPVPEGMHTVILTEAIPDQSLWFRFTDDPIGEGNLRLGQIFVRDSVGNPISRAALELEQCGTSNRMTTVNSDREGRILLEVPRAECYTVVGTSGTSEWTLTSRPVIDSGTSNFALDIVLERAGTEPTCEATAIEADLALPYEYGTTPVSVDCADGWAAIRWPESPGDNQRLVQLVDGEWTTYIGFPHQQCWAEARGNGVPDRLQKYFQEC